MFLKVSGQNTYQSFSSLFNNCILSCSFPDSMKLSEISPVYKKGDNLRKENYRSINVLSMMSKVFERILADQLILYFCNLLHSSLSAYRSGYSCQHVILQLTEYWRQALDDGNVVGTVAMDLSKAFDTMPHGLLIAKLHAYGISESACNILSSYLRNRMQRVKVSGKLSDLSLTNRGVPQGSVLGPLLFNIFINDLFYMKINSQICNYADDNHLCATSKCVTELTDTLESDSHHCIEWFKDNDMDANAGKFQSIAMDRDGKIPLSISVQGNVILPSNVLKVLGVSLEAGLKFDCHVTNICLKSSRQINVLKRLSRFLTPENRMLLYKSFIASNFHYCPVAWIFCGKRNSDKLEKIQERALRFVYSDYSSEYTDLLKRGNLLSLATYRIRFLAIEMYKCMNNLNPQYLNNVFEINTTPYAMRDSIRLKLPKYDTVRFGHNSFRYYGSKIWNAIPTDIKGSETLLIFKKRITQWCLSGDCDKFVIYSDKYKYLVER